MQISARILGHEYGLTAEEMNCILLKLGFLDGTPGDYSLTEKALPYAVEKDHHRGTGGYPFYNRYWTTRTFDDSIKEVLDVSSELIREVRDELATKRAARKAAQTIARSHADAKFLAKQVTEKTALEAAEQAVLDTEKLVAKWKKVGKIGLVVVGVTAVGYVIYKVTPKVKHWWKERKQRTSEKEENDVT